jgi:hypothetical protein
MNLFQSRADDWGKWCVATLRTMRCQLTPRACVRFGTTSLISGGGRFGDAAKGIAQRGTEPHNSWQHFCLPYESFIPGRMSVLPSITQGGSPVRE